MKIKIIFFTLMLFSVSLFLFAVDPTINQIGIQNNADQTQNVQPNDVVKVYGNTTNVPGTHTLTGVHGFNSSFQDQMYIYYRKSDDSANGGAWASITDYSDDASDNFWWTFTIPSSVPSLTAKVDIYCGLYCTNSGPPFDDQYGDATYSTTVSSAPSGYWSVLNFTFDTTTETPTMTLPADNQHDDNPTGIEFYLPEAGYDGTVKLSFTRSGEDHECTIVSEAQGTHSFNINPVNLSNSSEIESVTGGNSLTANVPYTVTIEYEDVLQNGVASDNNTGYMYDTITETPTLDAPVNLAVIDLSFSIIYDQPEDATDNTVKITFTRTGGSADAGSPHVLTVVSEDSGTDIHIAFDGSDLDAGSEVTLTSGNDILVSGAIYSIKFEYQDFLGNAVSSDTNISITYSTDAIIYASGGDYGAASFNPNSDNNAFFRFQLYWNNTGTQPSVTSIQFDILGTYSASDVKTSGMKLWRSTDNSFNAGSDTQIGSSIDIADPLTFSSLSETILTTPGYYYFVTVDVSATASGSDEIGAEIDQASHITTGATVSGSFPISGSTHPLPVTMSSFTAQFTNGKPTLYWTTQSETNNEGWNIYRSLSQNMGQGILVNLGGLIPGQGTTSEPTDYIYTDQNGVVENTTYWYWLESVDSGGETEMFGPISLTIPLGGGNSGTPVAPGNYGLYQNYPNPFNPSTEIRFALDESSYVILTIYNTKGQKIQTLFKGNVPADIVESVLWNGRDNSGKQVASGIYLYELQTQKETYTRKMILTK